MDKLQWGDVLCGVEVTPESWVGGVVSAEGHWLRNVAVALAVQGVPTSSLLMTTSGPVSARYPTGWENHTAPFPAPIFPPLGWAGRTEADLWITIVGLDWESGWNLGQNVHHIGYLRGYNDATGRLNGDPYLCNRPVIKHGWTRDLVELPALILALQNAQVLAARLQQP